MRNAFAAELFGLAEKDEEIVLLTADIGNRLFDAFKKDFPGRFYNCGVAEANMISVAAGLALSGMKPVTYTITPFITVRCLEQIKIDVCYHNLPVVIVGTGSGLSYGELGPTHHSCDDITLLRVMPNMAIVCPGDPIEARQALSAALSHHGPVYIRLGKKGEHNIHVNPPQFKLGKAIVIRPGTEVCLLSTGNMLASAVEVADKLSDKRISTQVVSFHTIKPLDEEMLLGAFSHFKLVITLEEQSLVGGFGSAVAEWLVDRKWPVTNLLRLGSPDVFLDEAGGQRYLRQQIGLDSEAIVNRIMQRM
jgi:transketolase